MESAGIMPLCYLLPQTYNEQQINLGPDNLTVMAWQRSSRSFSFGAARSLNGSKNVILNSNSKQFRNAQMNGDKEMDVDMW